jgi:hypothetical protein
VITPESLFSSFRPVKSAGFEPFQVEFDCCSHGSCVGPTIYRHSGKSKRRDLR